MDEARSRKVFAENLSHFIEQKRVYKKDVAAYCGVSTGTFSDWIKARSYPRVGKIQKLAEFFECDKSDLIEERSYDSQYYLKKEVEILYDDLLSDPEAVEIFQTIKKLSPDEREIVKSLMKKIIKEE